jgi:MFS family permease
MLSKAKGRYLSALPRSRHFWYFMVSIGVSTFARTTIDPFLPVFLNRDLNISVGGVSILYFTSGILGTVSVFLVGWLADKFGRKLIYIFGNSAHVIVPAALTRLNAFGQLLPLMSISGVMESAERTSQTTIIADQVEENKRNTGYGIGRIIGNAAWIIAPLIGGILLAERGFGQLFIISAILGLIGFALFIVLVPESRKTGLEKPSLPKISVLKDRDLFVLCVASLFSMLFYTQFYSLLPIFASQVRGLSEIEIGLLFSASGATVVLLQLPTSSWLEKLPRKTGYILGVVIMAAGITSLALAPSFHWLIFAVVVMTIGENMFFPIASAFVAEIAPEAERGTYFGAFSLFLSVGGNVSPLLGGTIWQITGNPFLPWLLSPIYAGISVALALLLHKRHV